MKSMSGSLDGLWSLCPQGWCRLRTLLNQISRLSLDSNSLDKKDQGWRISAGWPSRDFWRSFCPREGMTGQDPGGLCERGLSDGEYSHNPIWVVDSALFESRKTGGLLRRLLPETPVNPSTSEEKERRQVLRGFSRYSENTP